MKSRFMVTEVDERPQSRNCPTCDRPMVYLSEQKRYQCFKCIKAREEPYPFWLFIAILIVMIIIIILGLVFGPYATDTKGESEGDVDVVASHWSAIVYLVVLVVAVVVAHLLKGGKERCPKCGKVLRLVREVQKYKCLRCGAWYDKDDIEVEVFD